jgi:antirestriction protein ArdC
VEQIDGLPPQYLGPTQGPQLDPAARIERSEILRRDRGRHRAWRQQSLLHARHE